MPTHQQLRILICCAILPPIAFAAAVAITPNFYIGIPAAILLAMVTQFRWSAQAPVQRLTLLTMLFPALVAAVLNTAVAFPLGVRVFLMIWSIETRTIHRPFDPDLALSYLTVLGLAPMATATLAGHFLGKWRARKLAQPA